MKRIFPVLSIFAACAILFALAACQKDSNLQGEQVPALDEGLLGELTQVSFAVNLSDEAQTKAISDGLSANSLQYAVYRAETYVSSNNTEYLKGTYIPSLSQGDDPNAAFSNAVIEDKGNGNWVVTLTLAKNVKYDIVFWAYANGAPYKFDEAAAQIIVTDNYKGLANAENRDAFYGICRDYSVISSETKVELKRPFAQINFGASDYVPYITDLGLEMTSTIDTKYHAAVDAVYEHNDPVNGRLLYPARPSVASCEVPTVLNVLTGAVGGGAVVNFATAMIPYETEVNVPDSESRNKILLSTGEGDDKVDYHWMGMNYILAGDERATIDNIHAVFTYNNHDLIVDVPNVPYRRNFKTNIIGNIFTGKSRFNVVIMPGYVDTYVRDLDQYSTLNAVEKALFDAVEKNELSAQTTLISDLSVESTITVPAGMELVVDLGGKNIASSVSPAFVVEGSLKLVNGSAAVVGEFIQAAANAQIVLEGVSVVSGSETVDGDNCVFVPIDAKNVKVTVDAASELLSYNAPAIQCNGNTKGFELVVAGEVVSIGSHGMYLPQVASCTLESTAVVSGVTGVEIRGGNLVVMDGAQVTATGAFSSAANGNGSTVDGAAIAVSPHSTNLPINVTINGGVFTGAYSICEVNYETDRTAQTSIVINGGTFNGPQRLIATN